MSEGKTSLENLRVEYSEASNNRRHYSNLRFAVLSVCFAVLGGLSSVAFEIVEIKSPSPSHVVLGARIGGFIFTVFFFSFEILCVLYLCHFERIAKELEDQLGYKQLTMRKLQRYMPGVFLAWGMYLLLIVFWLISIFRR